MKLKHIKFFEDVAMGGGGDPMYGNDIFKIRYRQLDDMSNKKAPDTKDKPNNDLLDQFQEGDHVCGKGMHDDKDHVGEVVAIKKDEKGENTEITIEEDGKIVHIKPGTVRFQEDGEKGNKKREVVEPTGTEIYGTNYDTFQPATYEHNSRKDGIKTFSQFHGDKD